MIRDAADGTTGRRVWRLSIPGVPATYVIAATEQAARDWFAGQTPGFTQDLVTVTDEGSADRTEIALWRDETRLPPNATTTDPPAGSA